MPWHFMWNPERLTPLPLVIRSLWDVNKAADTNMRCCVCVWTQIWPCFSLNNVNDWLERRWEDGEMLLGVCKLTVFQTLSSEYSTRCCSVFRSKPWMCFTLHTLILPHAWLSTMFSLKWRRLYSNKGQLAGQVSCSRFNWELRKTLFCNKV